MLITEIFVFTGIFAFGYLASRVAIQEKRIKALERKLSKTPSAPSLPEVELASPVLEGLRISIQIQQDHPRPVFATLLKDRLFSEDAIPTIVEPGEIVEADLTIRGTVQCNGYEEMFFSATLQCDTFEATILTLAENPPQGGRQANLSNTLVTRLKSDLEKNAERRERRMALKELGA